MSVCTAYPLEFINGRFETRIKLKRFTLCLPEPSPERAQKYEEFYYKRSKEVTFLNKIFNFHVDNQKRREINLICIQGLPQPTISDKLLHAALRGFANLFLKLLPFLEANCGI